MVLAPFAHHKRDLLPIPSSQVSPIQLCELLRVSLEEAHDGRVAPFLSVLSVLRAACTRLWSLRSLVESVGRGSLADLLPVLPLFAATVIVEGVSIVVGIVSNGFGWDRSDGDGDGGGREVVRGVRLVEVVVIVTEEREVVVVVARGHNGERGRYGVVGDVREREWRVERRCVWEGLTERAFREWVWYLPSRG